VKFRAPPPSLHTPSLPTVLSTPTTHPSVTPTFPLYLPPPSPPSYSSLPLPYLRRGTCSGTLSPLDSFASEFMMKFPVRLENPHVISPHQVPCGALPRGRPVLLSPAVTLQGSADLPPPLPQLGVVLAQHKLADIRPDGAARTA
jgi:hypothetical protein